MSKRAPALHPIGPIVDEVIAAIAHRSKMQHRTRNKLMTEQEIAALRTIVRYLWRDEQKNFAECKLNDGEPPDDHVFSHLETLGRYLTRAQATDVPPLL